MSPRAVGTPYLVHQSSKSQSPGRAGRQETCQTSSTSAPNTPLRHTHRIVGHAQLSQPLLAKTNKPLVADTTSSDSMRNQDDGDPHDLSFPTKHFPRASMVDNLVMSLDQFAPATDTPRPYASTSAPVRSEEAANSSAVPPDIPSSETRLREVPAVNAKAVKENSKAHHQIPYVFVDEEESQREKAYNAQRAMQPNKVVSTKVNTRTKSRSDSSSSSVDLGHLTIYAARLGPAGNRRSQSFDFGSTRPKPSLGAGTTSQPQITHRATDGVYTSTATTTTNHDKSNKTMPGRKGRSGTLGAANGKPRLESPTPSTAVKSIPLDTTDGRTMPLPSAQLDQYGASRAGFFRRVFGSSSRSSTNLAANQSPSRPSQDRTGSSMGVRRPVTPPAKTPRQTPSDLSHNKENQPVITKKPSSFFRRRKKSTSGGVPPPLPLTLNAGLDTSKVGAGGSSPVSSLRAFMDPYLGEGATKHVRGSSLQSVQNAEDGIAKDVSTITNTQTKIQNNTEDVDLVSSIRKQEPVVTGSANPLATVNHSADAAKASRASGLAIRAASPASQTHAKLQAATSSRSSPAKNDMTRSARVTTPSPTLDRSLNLSQQQDTRGDVKSPVTFTHPTALSRPDPSTATKSIKLVPQSSGSDTSDYRSAPSTPLVAEIPDRTSSKPIAVHVSHPSMTGIPVNKDIEQARKIFDNSDEVISSADAAAWLGEASGERERIRIAYMNLFDWANLTILAALRNLCSKLVLRGETQQVDRILDTFAKRWCACNSNHGFKSADVVHTICYSILLLNTDLHMADIGRKMTKGEFIRNAIDAIRESTAGSDIGEQSASSNLLTIKTSNRGSPSPTSMRPSNDRSPSSLSTTRPHDHLSRDESYEDGAAHTSGPLVEAPFSGSQSGWETQIEIVLKDFYFSISKEPLPLFGSQPMEKSTPQQSSNNLSAFSTLRRTPSTISKATSENRGRYGSESRSLGARWTSKTRSRVRLGGTQAFGSSRTSIDDQSSAWSPSMSSTWSKASLGKTLTSMSVDSFGSEHIGGGYQSSIGFANALSQAIIRDEQLDSHVDEGIKAVPLLEDESLELYGAPWAKEGILKHKCHLEGVDKRSKDRNWNDCFAVIEKGWMRLFSFSLTAKSLRNKARNQKAGGVVGGGNWQDNAEEVWKFMLRHTIASSLPPPGYSKQKPYVWALSLPNGAVHLFSVGTPDIVKEFVTTANFWSARLSKEPMVGGVSSMEYGWSDSVINRALVPSESHHNLSAGSPRPSTQLSMRSSVDHGSIRPRLPGDKAHISEWVPPQQSLMASQLLEIDQMRALQTYIKNIEEELTKHNELRGPMLLAFSTRHPNSQKAMSNWEKKSSYLLREIVKFRTYVDALQSAQGTKQKVDRLKQEKERSRAIAVQAVELPVGEV